MPAHAELAGALLECLKDVGSLLEHAHATALQQRDALVQNDLDTVASTSSSQDEVLRRVAQADERAAAIAAQIADAAGVDIGTAGPDAIVEIVGEPYALHLRHELARIPGLSQQVRDVNETNSKLIGNGLDVITTCLRIVSRESEPTVYSQTASRAGAGNSALSLDSRV